MYMNLGIKFKSWSDIDEDKLEQDLIKKFKLSGLSECRPNCY